jgi:dethiobiotin synthetase
VSAGLFVTGTDTGVGKTAVAAAILAGARMAGLRARGMKPVASGCYRGDHGWRNADAELLQRESAGSPDYDDVNPCAFELAVAPHLAARAAAQTIEPAPILAAHGRLGRGADLVVVEGIGGWLVPLGPDFTTEDLARQLDLPVLLVVGMRLGCLNHALLSARAIGESGLRLVGWVANRIDPGMACFEENRAALVDRLGAPCVGTIPSLGDARPEAVAAVLEMKTIIDSAIKNIK